MSFWSWLTGDRMPPASADNPGDPHGVEWAGEIAEARALPSVYPSGWAGWPAQWATPDWSNSAVSPLIDVAWACCDTNARVLSSMPCYRLKNGEILPPLSWMVNPDPDIYTSWAEFAKELFWSFQAAGEAFVLPMAHGADGYPLRFRCVPPALVSVELRNGSRQYFLGGSEFGQDITGEVLHIRYMSSTIDAHGHGPLESAGARITAAGLLQRYAHRLAETGGTPHYWIGVDRRLNPGEAQDLLDQWVKSRTANAGHPALLSGNASLNQLQSMNAKDMALLELSQFNEARIAILLGVPPFLVGLPSALGESMTYSNTSNLFDFHYRSSLCPQATAVMSALSGWLLPRGQSLELNRDDYIKPSLVDRAQAYKVLLEAGVVSRDEVRQMERFNGPAPAGAALTGAEMTGAEPSPVPQEEGNTNAVQSA